MLNRRRVIRFRTHYQPQPTARKKQQSLLRSGDTSKDPLYEGTFRVRTLNRSGSVQSVSSMHHLQPHPVHDYLRTHESIQAVILHPHQFNGSQIIAKCREEMLRKNYDQVSTVISHELSSALHSTGAQNQMQSQVAGTSKSNGQQPQPVQTAPSPGKGVKREPRRAVINGH